jgi:GT2 family glycosyltransferase
MKASIIILNWNKAEDTCEAIESVAKQDYEDKEIIVVDNASRDDSVNIIKGRFNDVKMICLKKNIGCPSGRNVGAKAASGDILFFLDDDGLYKEDNLISKTIRVFEARQNLGALYFKVSNFFTNKDDNPLCRDSKHIQVAQYSASFRGGASAIRGDLFKNLGGYPDDFFRQCEERYLSLKMYSAGYYILYYPKLTMIHKEKSSNQKNLVVKRYQIENEMKTLFRLYPDSYVALMFMIKFLNSTKFLLKNKMVKEYLVLLKNLNKIFFKRRSFDTPIGKKSFLVHEALKYKTIINEDDMKILYQNATFGNILFGKLKIPKNV